MRKKQGVRRNLLIMLVSAYLFWGYLPVFATLNFQGLGDCTVFDMTPDGSVLVGAAPFGNSYLQGFRLQNGIMTPLGGLQGTPDPSYFLSYADGVSADGATVVGVSASPSGNQAFRWKNGVMQGLGYLPGSGYRSRALAASADGSVIVGYSKMVSLNYDEAVRWTNGVISSLHRGLGSTAYDVTPDGTIIVGTSSDGAFRWENGSNKILIDPGTAWKVTPNGSVVIGWTGAKKAFRWEDDVLTELGVLPGTSSSYAYGVNHDGSVIVGSCDSGVAFIWDSVHGIRNLKDVLENDYGLDLTGWSLSQARALSDDGLIIAGWGTGPDGSTSWIATIPEPGTVVLLGLGAVLARKRSKIKKAQKEKAE